MPHPDELAPDARARWFREMVRAGMTCREIAEQTGYTEYTAARVCAGLGLEPSRRGLTGWDARTNSRHGTA